MVGAAPDAGGQHVGVAADGRTEEELRAEIQTLQATVQDLRQLVGEKDALVRELREQAAGHPSKLRDNFPRRQSLSGGNTRRGSLASLPEGEGLDISGLSAVLDDRARGEHVGLDDGDDPNRDHADMVFALTSDRAQQASADSKFATTGNALDIPTLPPSVSRQASTMSDAWFRDEGTGSAKTEQIVMELQSHIRVLEAQRDMSQLDQEEIAVLRARVHELECRVEELQELQAPRSWSASLMNSFCCADRSSVQHAPFNLEGSRKPQSPPKFSGPR